MEIRLIDVDSHNFPNIPLMKISAYHKRIGDHVDWYSPLIDENIDIVYVSKIFSFTQDYQYEIKAKDIRYGGSGYAIKIKDGVEIYDKSIDKDLPDYIEHIYPDYSLYSELTKDTAYGRLTIGCPRKCSFCHTGVKDGLIAHKVADLTEFWNGQKNITLIDQNILACKEWKKLLQQCIDSKAKIEFNGGLDVRLMTEEKAEYIKKIKNGLIHFAWDRHQDKDIILPKFKLFKDITGFSERKMVVYTIVNFDTTLDQDLDRVYTLRSMGYWAYIMIYEKDKLPKGHVLLKLQRWVNNRFIFAKCKTFDEYLGTKKQEFVDQVTMFDLI